MATDVFSVGYRSGRIQHDEKGEKEYAFGGQSTKIHPGVHKHAEKCQLAVVRAVRTPETRCAKLRGVQSSRFLAELGF